MKLLRMLGIALVAVAAVGVASAQSWTPVQNVPIPAGAIALLTDGRVMVHEEQSNAGTWYILTPDINGHYETGTWTHIASMPSGYAPLFFGSAVLPDGRYIARRRGVQQWQRSLDDEGRHLRSRCQHLDLGHSAQRLDLHRRLPQRHSDQWNLHAEQLLRHVRQRRLCWMLQPYLDLDRSGKFDIYDEEGMTLLPGGNVLDVDAYVFAYNSAGKNWETVQSRARCLDHGKAARQSSTGIRQPTAADRAAPPTSWVRPC